MGIKYHPKYCSYFPLLLKALEMVDGDVLELGAGLNSTFFLHWFCHDRGRQLHTYDNSPFYYEIAQKCASDSHTVHLVDDWNAVDLERAWGVVLVDHAPASRRKEEARRLANHAQVILLHDSQWKAERHYHYKEVYPLFRYRYDYPAKPQTTAVSNFVDVGAWHE